MAVIAIFDAMVVVATMDRRDGAYHPGLLSRDFARAVLEWRKAHTRVHAWRYIMSSTKRNVRPVDRARDFVADTVDRTKESMHDHLGSARERLEDAAHGASEKFQERYGETAEHLRDRYHDVEKSVGEVAEDVGDYVRDNPGKSILIAAAAGFLLGLLAGGGRHRD